MELLRLLYCLPLPSHPKKSPMHAIPGQAVMPHPVEGMRNCIVKLLKAGGPQNDIDLLVRGNPAWLIGLNR